MRVKFGSETFRIQFRYEPCVRTIESEEEGGNKWEVQHTFPGWDTYCTIEKLFIRLEPSPEDETKMVEKVYGTEPVAFGDAYLHPSDPYDRPLGRKMAFARAVNKETISDHAFRTALWKAFRQTHKIPGKRGTPPHIHAK